MKEKWLADDQSPDSVLSYIVKLKERPQSACEPAQKHLQKAQGEMKI